MMSLDPQDRALFAHHLRILRPRPAECKGWKKYEGLREPRCCGGVGCDKCWAIYQKKNGYK